MVLTSFSMFGQKIIDPQGNTGKDPHAQRKATSIREAHPNGNNHLQTNSEAQKAFNVRLQAKWIVI
jgi:hypothetical protein